MSRKFVCGLSLAFGLALAVGCDKASTPPAKTTEQMKKENQEMMDKMKPAGAPPAGTATPK